MGLHAADAQSNTGATTCRARVSARSRKSAAWAALNAARPRAALSFLQNYLNPSKLRCAVTINRHRIPPETTAEKIAHLIVIVLGILIGQLIASRLF